MHANFKLLSLKEEIKLSKKELESYYDKFRTFVLNRKLTNTTVGATFWGPKLKKITAKIAIAVTHLFSCKNVEWVFDGTEHIPEGAVIFAHIHQGILDNFVWIPELNKHCLLLHGAEVNKLLLLCQLNTGLILVKKEDRKNNLNAKLDMIRLLLEGHSITYFPEGTWNLSPNKLYLPLRFGFLDIARKANVPVVPVVHEYTYSQQTITKIHSRYGKPIYITLEDNIDEKLNEYQETIATMSFELIEEKGLFHRESISNHDYINFLKNSYKNLKLGKLDWEKERRNIHGANDAFYLFNHINDVPFNDNGKLLDTEESIRLERLFNMNRYK
ncbi:MAG: 1-acyl-sn-glycerol-3-phosphate acyltransferase [Clostridia bacterium]|nr:1-acyl-sn-glycerol-3-phosphate acyltransferase [Clostridia bacterium]